MPNEVRAHFIEAHNDYMMWREAMLNSIADDLEGRCLLDVARATSVNRNLLADFRNRRARNPRYYIIKILADYLEAN